MKQLVGAHIEDLEARIGELEALRRACVEASDRLDAVLADD